jgi:hypothetical protein
MKRSIMKGALTMQSKFIVYAAAIIALCITTTSCASSLEERDLFVKNLTNYKDYNTNDYRIEFPHEMDGYLVSLVEHPDTLMFLAVEPDKNFYGKGDLLQIRAKEIYNERVCGCIKVKVRKSRVVDGRPIFGDAQAVKAYTLLYVKPAEVEGIPPERK